MNDYRTREDIKAAKASYDNMLQRDAISNLPPGYLSGGDITIDGTDVYIGPLIANINGKRVEKTTSTNVRDMNWVGVKLPSTYYYVYLDRIGIWTVDTVEPVLVGGLYGLYRPETGARYVAELYVDTDGDITDVVSHRRIRANDMELDYLQTEFLRATSSVIIGYEGDGSPSFPLEGDKRVYIDGDELRFEIRAGGVWTTQSLITASGNVEYNITVDSFIKTEDNVLKIQGDLQSSTFETGLSGWILDNEGNVEINDLIARGTIYADGGEVGGFTITDTSLTASNLAFENTGDITAGELDSVIRISSSDATYCLWAGNSFAASAPFRVSKTGEVTADNLIAEGGTIGGFTLNETSLKASDGSNHIALSIGEGIYLGGNTPETAPFHVNTNGFLKANYMELTAPVIKTSSDPTGNRIEIDTNGIHGYDEDFGMTFKIPTDGSAPMFANGIIELATIRQTTIISNDFKTSDELPWVEMTNEGLGFREAESAGQYGEGQEYGEAGLTYGVGVTAYFGHPSYPAFSVTRMRSVADMRLYNRSSLPSGACVVGDICCVSGVLQICTVAGTPGTWVSVGGQT